MSQELKQKNYPKEVTLINLSPLSASNTSEWIPVHASETLTLEFDHVNTSGALTITGYFETRRDGETTGRRMQTKATLAGVETLSNRSFSKAVTGSLKWSEVLSDLNDQWIRVVSITAAGAAATDTISMHAIVAYRRG